MSLIVQKFGGSSVADAKKIFNVAGRITDEYNKGNDVVVVVSAMGDTTDDLIEKAKEINDKASRREMDVLLSTGEQITISLLDGFSLISFAFSIKSSVVSPIAETTTTTSLPSL